MREKTINSGELRELEFADTLLRIYAIEEYGKDSPAIKDSFHSTIIRGPPGVGKSAQQILVAKDVARYLSELEKKAIEVKEVSIRVSNEDAISIAKEVEEGNAIPYLHLYLPQTKIWNLEGTPSALDNFAKINDKSIPVNLWRIDAFFLPFLDSIDSKNHPAFLILDEFNMAKKEVQDALFQLARSAELGRAKLNPLTQIILLGNTREFNVDASDIPAPLLDRASNYIIDKPTVDSWIGYMREVYGQKWASEIGGFLVLNPNFLFQFQSGEESTVQTPRSFTFVATDLYLLKKLKSVHILSDEQYWAMVDKKLHSYLFENVANELYGFLRSLVAVNVNEILDNPEKLRSLDHNVVAYLLVKITNNLSEKYLELSEKSGKKVEEEKEKILKQIADLIGEASKNIKSEAISLALSSLPMNMKLALAKKLPSNVLSIASETSKVVRELEEVFTH